MRRALAIVLILSSLTAYVMGSSKFPLTEAEVYAIGRNHTIMLVNPRNYHSGGTGFSIRSSAGATYTLTNSHICAVEKDGYVTAKTDTRTLRLQVLSISQKADLCLLSAVPGVPGLTIAQSSQAFQLIYIVGHPLLRPITISQGYIIASAPIELISDKELDECDGPGQSVKQVLTWAGPVPVCIQKFDADWTNAQVFPGNSGSPVIDANGDVVGVLFAGDSAGNGYFVPLKDIQEFLRGF